LAKLLRAPAVRGLVWVTSSRDEALRFERVISMESGRITGEGADADVV